MSRTTRIAIRLISQLEDYYVHKRNPREDDEDDEDDEDSRSTEQSIRHQKVAELPKTKQKLEKWFAARKIPIRIMYATSEQLSVLPKPGVITFRYNPILDHPPTAWMIVHNLAHGIFDYVRTPNPYLLQEKVGHDYEHWSQKTIRDMDLFNENPGSIYPITRSALNTAIIDNIEAFYEVFTQWVTSGHIRLNSKDKFFARKWERELEHHFREIVDEVAKMGVVIHNI